MSERQPVGCFPTFQSSFLDDILGAALWLPFGWTLGQHVFTGGFSFAVHLWFGLLAVSSFVLMLLVSSLVKRRNFFSRQHWLLILVMTLVTGSVLWRFIVVHHREPPGMKLVIRVGQEAPGMPKSIRLRRDLPKWLEGLQPRIESRFDSSTNNFEFSNIRGGKWFIVPLPSGAYPPVGPIELPPNEGETREILNILPMEPLDPSVLGSVQPVPRPLPEASEPLPAEPSPELHPAPKPAPPVSRRADRKPASGSDYIPEGFSPRERKLLNDISAGQQLDNARNLRKGDPNKAKNILNRIIREFPETEAAKKARIELVSIRKEEGIDEN